MSLAPSSATAADPRKTTKVGDALSRNTVFRVLSAERRQALAECGCYVHLEKGQRLFGRGDISDAAYAIVVGEVEVTVEGMDGREVFLARLGSGQVIGEMGVLDGAPRSADVRATRKCELCRIDREQVTEALTKEPGAALALLGLMSRRLRDTDNLVARMSSMDLSKRLALLVLDESTRGKMVYTQSDIAHLVGATREAVNRTLTRWRKQGWVEVNATGIHIKDRAALMNLCKRKVET